MPNKEFLEECSLYRRFDFRYSPPIPRPSINMYCSVCRAEQTFKMDDKYEWDRKGIGNVLAAVDVGSGHGLGQVDQGDFIEHAMYECAACGKGTISFLLMFSPKGEFVQKVGQFPPWPTRVDRNVEKILGQHVETYKKGLICESQGYGIGSFAYYRRIVEQIIDELLDKLTEFIVEEKKTVYLKILERAKNIHSAQEKIELVKDLLPLSLRPNVGCPKMPSRGYFS